MMMVEVHIFLLLTKITFELSGSIKRSLYLGLLALIYWVKVPDQTTINTFTITYWKRGGWGYFDWVRWWGIVSRKPMHKPICIFARLWQSSGHKTLDARIWVTKQHALKQMLLRKLDINMCCYKVFNSFGSKGSNFHFDRFTAHSVWLQGSLIRGAWESETTTAAEAIVVKNSEGRIISSNVSLS